MSGDVQPRKRKDKRRKKESSSLGNINEPLGGQKIRQRSEDESEESPIVGSTDQGESIHIHNDHGIGGNVCVKIIFFCLLAALVGLVGVIFIQSRGSTDVDLPSIEDSRFAEYFTGWLDDASDDHGHDDHDLALQSGEDHDDEHDDEDDDEHDEDEDDDHDDEDEEGSEEPAQQSAEDDNDQADDDDNDDDEDEDDGNDKDDDDDDDDKQVDVKQSAEGDDNDDDDDNDNDDDADGNDDEDEDGDGDDIEEEDLDASQAEDDDDDDGVNENDDDEDDEDEEEEDNKAEEEIDEDFKPIAIIDADQSFEEIEESEEALQEEAIAIREEKLDGLEIDPDDESLEEQEGGEDDDEEEEEEIPKKRRKIEKVEKPKKKEIEIRRTPRKIIPLMIEEDKDDEEDKEEEDVEAETGGVAVKLGVGIALIVVAHLVLVRKWNSLGNVPTDEKEAGGEEGATDEKNESEENTNGANETEPVISRRQTLIPENVKLSGEVEEGEYSEEEGNPKKKSREDEDEEEEYSEELEEEEEYEDEELEEEEELEDEEEFEDEEEEEEYEEEEEEEVVQDNRKWRRIPSKEEENPSEEDDDEPPPPPPPPRRTGQSQQVSTEKRARGPQGIEGQTGLPQIDGNDDDDDDDNDDDDNEVKDDNDDDDDDDNDNDGDGDDDDDDDNGNDDDDDDNDNDNDDKNDDDDDDDDNNDNDNDDDDDDDDDDNNDNDNDNNDDDDDDDNDNDDDNDDDNDNDNKNDDDDDDDDNKDDDDDEGINVSGPDDNDILDNKRPDDDDDDWAFRQELDFADDQFDNNPKLALEKYEDVIKKKPTALRALIGRAKALDKIAELERSNRYLRMATAAYKQVLLENAAKVPDKKFLELADRCINRMRFSGDLESAVAIHKALIMKFPKIPKHRNDLAVTYLILNRIDPAKRLLNETLTLWPNDGFALVHYGFILKTSDNNMEEAVEKMTAGIRTKEKGVIDGRFFFHLGDALNRLGRGKEAIEWYDLGFKEGLFISRYQRSLYNVNRLKGQPWWTQQETTYQNFFKSLEDNWKKIRAEGLALYNAKGVNLFKDEAENLKDTGDWKQLDLFFRGRKQANCNKAPITCSLIDAFPPAATCTRGQAKFSIMLPNTHVWPHCGPTNCRLRSHLGLVVPKNTFLRVAEDTRSWEEGKVIVFDDSFEHEVWHNGTAPRLVLIVDVWHPGLTMQERQNLTPI